MLSNRNWLIHSIELEEDKHTDVAAKLDGYVYIVQSRYRDEVVSAHVSLEKEGCAIRRGLLVVRSASPEMKDPHACLI